MKKTFWRLSIFAAIVVCIYAFRHFFIGTIVEIALHRSSGEPVHYDKRYWKEGKLIYEGFSLGENFQAEKVSFACDFNRSPFFLTSKVRIKAPLINLENENTKQLNLAFLIPTKYATVKLDVKDGSLSSRDGTHYKFDFVSGSGREEIGILTTQLFTCGFAYTEGSLALDLEMEEASVLQTVQLAALFYPLPEWTKLEGTASAHLYGEITPNAVHVVQGDFQLQNTRWESKELLFAIDDVKGQVDFHGAIDALALSSEFQGFDLFWKELEIIGGHGALQFKPKEVPTLDAHAALNIGEVEGRADLCGRGEILADNTVWFEGVFDYTTNKTPMKVDFSWADDQKTPVLYTEVHTMGTEVLALLAKPFVKVSQGTLDGKITVFFQHGACQRLEFEDLHVDHLACEHGAFEHLKGTGALNFDEGWSVEQLALQLRNGATNVLSEIDAHIAIKDDCFQTTTARGKLRDIPGEATFQGPLSAFHSDVKLKAGASQWLQLPKNIDEPPIILEAGIERHFDTLQITAAVRCLQDSITVQAETTFAGIFKGDFQTSKISKPSYLPFLKILAPTAAMEGDLLFTGHFSNDLIEVIGQGKDLGIQVAEYQLTIPGKTEPVAFHYDFGLQQGSGNGKMSPLLLKTDKGILAVTDGDFIFDHRSWTCHNLAAHIGGIELLGNLKAEWESKFQADFIAQRVHGTIDDIRAVYPLPLPEIQGVFESSSFQLHLEKGSDRFQIRALFRDVEGPITEYLSLHDAECVLGFNSMDEQLALTDMRGQLRSFLGETVAFSAQIEKNTAWNFDASFSQGSWDILHIRGQANGGDISIHEAEASGSYLKTPLSCRIDKGRIKQAEGVIHLETAMLPKQMRLAERMGLITPLNLPQMTGGIILRLHLDEISHYELDGSELSFNSTFFHSVQAHLENQGNEWFLRRCQLDDWKLKGHAALQKEKWIMPFWEVDWKELHLRGTAIYEKEVFDFQTEGSLSLYRIKGAGLFTASSFQDLNFEVMQDQKTVATLGCEKLFLKAGKWESPAVDVAIFSPHLEQPLCSKLKVSLGKESTFQGVATGQAKIGTSTLKIGQIFGLYDSHLNLKCVASLDGEPLHFIWKLSPNLSGGLQIQKGDETLKVSLSHPTVWQTAQGDLLGLHLDLQREAEGFKGTVFVNDGFYLAHFLENDDLHNLGGLQLHGTWASGGFQGDLTGEEAFVKEYLIHELHAQVDYAPTHFRLKNITLQDPAGSFTIKECLGLRTSAHDKWNITIPLVKAQEVRPSGLRKRGESSKELKPFLIRHLVMTDISGQLGDLQSLRGYGSFNFSQRVKKETSLFDIPLTLLKDLGLDLDLFSPVMGEVHLNLKDGKIYLTDLQHAFSEGKRSEFYLHDDPSFIDFNGRLSLNLRMKQNVVLKLVEPFMIAVRGTWEKPQYSLK